MINRTRMAFFPSLAGLFLLLAGCQTTATPRVEPAAVRTATSTLSPPTTTSLPGPSATPPMTASPPTATPTVPPTPQPTATVVASPSPTPFQRSAGQLCPDQPPPRPVYDRLNLGEESWLQPAQGDTIVSPEMVWPIITGELPRINHSYTYGADGNGRFLIHNGLDMGEPMGTPVRAVGEGTIVVAGSDEAEMYGRRCDWYGQLVVLELNQQANGQPVFVLYGHVLELAVEEGQQVSRGQPLAEVGFGGVATAPHLHLEVRVGQNEFGATQNPLLWLRPPEGYGVVVGRLVDRDGRPWQGVTMTLIDRTGQSDFQFTTTYLGDPDGLIHPHEQWAENFAFGLVPPGDYDVFAEVEGVEYRQRVVVVDGQLTSVEIITEPGTAVTPSLTPAS